MLLRLLLAVLFTGLSYSWCLAQSWSALKLGPVATIELPGPPDVRELQGQQVHTTSDSTSVFTVIVQAVDTAADFRIRRDEIKEFYTSVIDGALRTAHNASNVRRSAFTIDGLAGAELQFSVPTEATGLSEYTFRFLYLNGYLLSYNTTSPKNLTAREAARCRQFFASLHLDPQAKAEARQYTLTAEGQPYESRAYYLGALLGRIGMYLLISTLILWLVRRFTRRTGSHS